MGDVPVAATLNVAVCPAVTAWLDGCVVIVGGSACVWIPVPPTETAMFEPLWGVKTSVPTYACAAAGANRTEAVRLWP